MGSKVSRENNKASSSPAARRRHRKLSWRDTPLAHGESPRDVLKNLSRDMNISRTETELILTRVEKLRVGGYLRGWDALPVILTAAILYVRWPKAKRQPIGFSKFAEMCRGKGYDVDSRQIYRCRKLFRKAGLHPRSPTATEILDGQWKTLHKEIGLPDTAKQEIGGFLRDRRIVAGRSPQVVIAGLTYLCCKKYDLPISQSLLAHMFGIAEVSIRNFLNHLADEDIMEKRDFRYE